MMVRIVIAIFCKNNQVQSVKLGCVKQLFEGTIFVG